ncbi:PREDICTED: transmembrane protein 74B-like [Priapulus caudatus]|uniref:Transmembrane protein 74B-like n=1 Tax=Priapulus caudatus TaxID=37621 RepID=A0ABM1E8P5_PRICU|nr:PREDICTED: transmembrane protein 74B-like [Priapulus caudatus]
MAPAHKYGAYWAITYPKRHPMEFVAIFSTGFFLSGILLLSAGYVVPRHDYDDADEPTAAMTEAEQRQMAHRAFRLDVCIIVGLTLVCTSAVTLVVVLIAVTCHMGRKDYNELRCRQRLVGNDVPTSTTLHAVQPAARDLYYYDNSVDNMVYTEQ